MSGNNIKIPDIIKCTVEAILDASAVYSVPYIIGIDGRCCSGKTSLAEALAKAYGCDVFHADDFFLQSWQRTPERLAMPGGNIDYERLSKELLAPLSAGTNFSYRKFSCARMQLEPPTDVTPGRIAVMEGSYCMHPMLRSYYNLKIFLDVDPTLQLSRLQEREDTASVQRFQERWIPLEELYLKEMDIKAFCDFSFCLSDV